MAKAARGKSDTSTGQVLIGATELAKHLKISRQRIYQYIDEGKIPREPNGKFDLDKVLQALKRNLDIKQPARSLKSTDRSSQPGLSGQKIDGKRQPTFAEVQLQHEIAKTIKAQLEAKRLQETLVDIAEVEKTWSAMCTTFRNRMLLLPDKLAPRVSVVEDVRECSNLIFKEVEEALTALSEYQPDE